MKIKAKQWVKYHGEWHKAGDVFRIFEGDADMMKQYGEVIEEKEDKQADVPEEPTQEEPVRKGRKRKTEA